MRRVAELPEVVWADHLDMSLHSVHAIAPGYDLTLPVAPASPDCSVRPWRR
jgi:hypothetical protein